VDVAWVFLVAPHGAKSALCWSTLGYQYWGRHHQSNVVCDWDNGSTLHGAKTLKRLIKTFSRKLFLAKWKKLKSDESDKWILA
jgi:hypothetical protein